MEIQAKTRNLVFYGATSVDGYIARDDHSLDWLIGTDGEEEAGYAEFYETVDTILMGRKTYEQVLLLSPRQFLYKGKECYVFSHTMTGSNECVNFINEDIVSFTKALKKQEGNRIWIVGGGEVLFPLLQEKLVDEFFIQIAPTIIGQGIPLFLPGNHEHKLELLDVRRYKQLAELHYVSR
ncbi:dihydrofolate reductase family protein [Fictibacillus terranigra]|uniref:Dihydrofolate reductase family protein n=1 Tax=Fictibacillus terranigra TaxID=3058424 RepID=A0ABT8E8F0_9BACL|nr:dihydrofolate reductase family protein [Fictibacillus sp. CENA-BCM004]MDN4074165.1 dihydrofolate reductase family protein [Fictibacillus sp. CENA-BCM004]